MFESMTTRLEIEQQVRRYLGIGFRRWRWLVLGVGLGIAFGSYQYLKARLAFTRQPHRSLSLSHTTPQIMGRRIESVSNPLNGRWTNLKYERTQHRLMEGAELADAVARTLDVRSQLLKDLERLRGQGRSPSLSLSQERIRLKALARLWFRQEPLVGGCDR